MLTRAKIKRNEIEKKMAKLNIGLVNVKFELINRHTAYAIDVVDKYSGEFIETLFCGSKREVLVFILGFEKTLKYTRFLRDKDIAGGK